MKAPVILSALAAITVGSSAVLATLVGGNEARSPSPITVKLERRAKKAKPEDVNLKAWIDRGQDVQYYGELRMGSNRQKMLVNWDTASSDLVVPSANCSSCQLPGWPHNLYNPNTSTTYQPTPGDSFEACYGTGGTTIPFGFNYACADITLVTDKVCIHDLCAPAQTFGLASHFDAPFVEQPFDGIFGMPIEAAEGNSSLYWYLVQSGQLPSPEFSFYIEPRKVNGDEITLGGIDKSKFKGDIDYLPLSPISTDPRVMSWVLDLPAVYVDGKRLVNSTEPGKGQPIPFGEVKLDMGGAFIAVPNNETIVDIYSMISPEIHVIDPAIGIWGAKCDVIDRVAVDLTFTFGQVGGKQVNMTVPKENFNAGPLPDPYDHSLCQAIYVPVIGHDPVHRNPAWTFGVPLFKNYYTVWNGRDLTFGIARPNWKKASAP